VASQPETAPPRGSADTVADFDRWFNAELSKGKLHAIVSMWILFVVTVGIFAAQIALILILWLEIYPLASGATERTVVLGAIFAALSVFLVELRSVALSGLLYRFLVRPRRRRRSKTLDGSG